MHSAVVAPEALTESIRMFQLGIARGKPASGSIGAQPEWAYKGDGRYLVPPEQELTQPSFAVEGGEEAEIASLSLSLLLLLLDLPIVRITDTVPMLILTVE